MLLGHGLTRFEIRGLRGANDVAATLEDNKLIIVGENGSGKTTFLRMMFYFLSGRWPSLAQFRFFEVSAIINGRNYSLRHSDLVKFAPRMQERLIRRLPFSQRQRIRDLLEEGRVDEAENILNSLQSRLAPSDIRSNELALSVSPEILKDLHKSISEAIGAQVLYLPTYRRIERELSSIIQGIDGDDIRQPTLFQRPPENANDYVELVEFGMADVKRAIDNALEEIRNFQLSQTTHLSLSYLGEIVSQSYQSADISVIANTSDETIQAILSRIDSTILNSYHKQQLSKLLAAARMASGSLSEHDKIIYHYFNRLIGFQKELQRKEANLQLFCEICSVYIKDKDFVYESGKLNFNIRSKKTGIRIDLAGLSSGEKQIVSLFSHLHLSGREKFFVLIDEPELSLSVPWQRRFLLDIAQASFCAGLVAVTHSPFIYDNELRQYTHALEEFVHPTSGML